MFSKQQVFGRQIRGIIFTLYGQKYLSSLGCPRGITVCSAATGPTEVDGPLFFTPVLITPHPGTNFPPHLTVDHAMYLLSILKNTVRSFVRGGITKGFWMKETVVFGCVPRG
jgi:hypothetical protein